jgi:hypothetical protein
MMPYTNTALLKHPPEKHRPLTAHERSAAKAKRSKEQEMRSHALHSVRKLFARSGRRADDARGVTAKVS